jgi:hypothetical protein
MQGGTAEREKRIRHLIAQTRGDPTLRITQQMNDAGAQA